MNTYNNMTEQPILNSLKNDIIDKSVHTSNGVIIGNIHSIDDNSVVVKGDIISTVYYHIPIEKVKEWDGHALWLTIDDRESKNHVFPSHNKKESSTAAIEPLNLELDVDTLSQITQGANSHGISPASYINQIIKRYLDWDKFEPKADIVTISKPVAKELFDNLSEEQIISMAKNSAKNALKETVIKFVKEHEQEAQGKHKVDVNSFLSWLEDEMNSYAVEIRHIIGKHDSSRHRHHTYILKHDTGYNYSLYYKTLLESIFDDILQKHISVKMTNSMVTFEFEE